ncbi:hypothetical protein OA57_09770 [Chelonobacter oris]|uniref:Competence protein ComA n=1 Tax=Chelonobacter oris TaxID=505317 RepID=A0A0A3B8I1_9PAST|nr:hypothetical protein [Chelonobacter oris]KGQ69904.1 hypothetical protein OA57_09770 [Chelonobacter oris]
MRHMLFSPPPLPIGLYPNGQTVNIAFIDKRQQACFCQIESTDLARLPSLLRQQFAEKISKRQSFFYISCLEPHLLWQKHLLLPHTSAAERYRQVRLIVQQQLPLEEQLLQFDFNAAPLQHIGTARQIDYVQIYAAKKQNIRRYCAQFSPLKLNVLDVHAHALLRAFAYAGNSAIDENTLLIYHTPHQSVLLQQYQDKLFQHYADSQSPETLLQTFYRQNPKAQLKRYLIYADAAALAALSADITTNADIISLDPQHYPSLIALGCALWRANKE